ncbi:unnamed protein product [Caretta caretta]
MATSVWLRKHSSELILLFQTLYTGVLAALDEILMRFTEAQPTPKGLQSIFQVQDYTMSAINHSLPLLPPY